MLRMDKLGHGPTIACNFSAERRKKKRPLPLPSINDRGKVLDHTSLTYMRLSEQCGSSRKSREKKKNPNAANPVQAQCRLGTRRRYNTHIRFRLGLRKRHKHLQKGAAMYAKFTDRARKVMQLANQE